MMWVFYIVFERFVWFFALGVLLVLTFVHLWVTYVFSAVRFRFGVL